MANSVIISGLVAGYTACAVLTALVVTRKRTGGRTDGVAPATDHRPSSGCTRAAPPRRAGRRCSVRPGTRRLVSATRR